MCAAFIEKSPRLVWARGVRIRVLAVVACVIPSALGGFFGYEQWRSSNRSSEPFFSNLGTHTWPITTSSPLAQRYFDQAMAFLSGFNREEAIRSFQAAVANDPKCAMAYWGIALAHGPDINYPAVGKERGHAAWEALAKACGLARNVTDEEKRLIEALGERYDDPMPDDDLELRRAYAQAMLEVHDSFPENPDIGALTVEALFVASPMPRRPTPAANQARLHMVEILDEALAKDPHHVLALHLMIHVCEDTPLFDKAKQAAKTLEELNIELGHLLHMPSHVDIRVGKWREAVAANERALAADRAYLALGQKPSRYLHYVDHNSHMLAFAACMCGQSHKAEQAARDVARQFSRQHAGQQAAKNEGFLALPYEVEIRFGRWDAILAEPEPSNRSPMASALWHYARGVAYAAKKDVRLAKAEQQAFAGVRRAVPENEEFRKNSAQSILAVADAMLAGEILYREQKANEAVTVLTEGVMLEDALGGHDPPDWMLPVRHVLGATLMDCGKYAEAETVFRGDLAKYPENGWSLYGLAQSLKLQGKNAEAALVKARFDKVWADADFHLQSSCCCLPDRNQRAGMPSRPSFGRRDPHGR